jgi:hypothetical protein
MSECQLVEVLLLIAQSYLLYKYCNLDICNLLQVMLVTASPLVSGAHATPCHCDMSLAAFI